MTTTLTLDKVHLSRSFPSHSVRKRRGVSAFGFASVTNRPKTTKTKRAERVTLWFFWGGFFLNVWAACLFVGFFFEFGACPVPDDVSLRPQTKVKVENKNNSR